MIQGPLRWTPELIKRAVKVLGKHEHLQDAVAAVERDVGFPVTRAALDCALRKANLPTAFQQLRQRVRGPIPRVDARDTEQMRVAQSHELPDDSGTTDPDDGDADDRSIRLILEATKTKAIDLEAACDLIDRSPKAVRELIARARDQGYTLDLEGHSIGRRPPAVRSDVTPIAIQTANEWRTFAVASDIHVGSKFFLREQFIHFVHMAYERGVRVILGPGDILDGVYKHSQWEEYAHGFDAQAEDAARVFPRLPGLRYVMIAGNHDQTHETSSGMDVSKALEDVFRRNGRDDLTMLGARGGTVDLRADGDARGLRVEMWHPLGGGAYALSYKLQRKIESYPVGQKPDVVLAGHWHQQCYFTQRGIHAMSCGTWHGGQSPFGKALGTTPAIGGWIVEYAQTADGTVRHFRPEWVAFFENEQPRVVSL